MTTKKELTNADLELIRRSLKSSVLEIEETLESLGDMASITDVTKKALMKWNRHTIELYREVLEKIG